jgi:hypothetical protein
MALVEDLGDLGLRVELVTRFGLHDDLAEAPVAGQGVLNGGLRQTARRPPVHVVTRCEQALVLPYVWLTALRDEGRSLSSAPKSES